MTQDVECGTINVDTGKTCELKAGHPVPYGKVNGIEVHHAHDNPDHILTWWQEHPVPTPKAQGINDLIKHVMGKDRVETIQAGKCMTCDVESVGEFKDALSRKEYTISGMCQSCQDAVFGE